MKAMKYLFLAAATCFALTSCLDGDDSLLNDDWNDPQFQEAPFGNNSITEDGIITAHFQVDFWTAILAVVVISVMGVLAGLAPAWRAMSIKPVDAIRDE